MLEDPNADEDLIPPDERRPQRLLDSRIQADGELSDSDDEGDGGRKNHASHKERDSVNGTGGRRMATVGIMGSGTSAAGPSGATTAQRVLSSGSMKPMEVDTPTTVTPAEPAENGAEATEAPVSKAPTPPPVSADQDVTMA